MKLLQNVRVPSPVRGLRSNGTGFRSLGLPSRRVLGAFLIVLSSLLVGALPASAHASLLSSSPADGAKLAKAPKTVVLTFGERLLPAGNAVTATDLKSNTRISLPAPKIKGAKLTVAWPKSARASKYRVAYRVVSADGHPVTGRITFSYRKTLASSGLPIETASPIAEQVRVEEPDNAQALAAVPVNYPVNAAALLWIMGFGAAGLGIAGLAAWHTHRRLG